MAKARQTARIQRNQPKGHARQPAKRRTGTSRRRGSRPRRYSEAWTGTPGRPMTAVGSPAIARSEAPRDLLMRAASEKYPWIRRFVEEGCPRGKLQEYALAYAQAAGIAEDQVPPYTTLNTWAHRYRQSGLEGLIDRPRRDAGHSRRVVGDIAARVDIFATLGHGATRILNELARLYPGTKLPSRPSLYRALRRFCADTPHLVAIARKGPVWFRHVCEVAFSYGAMPGGVRLAIDSTVADQWVRVADAHNPLGWVPMRPVLTLILDVGSRLLVTFNLSLYAIDSGICLGVLGRAIDQDRNYPGLLSVGVPFEITLDKGSEHLGSFEAALTTLTIATVPRRANDPRASGHIERLIGTLQRDVFSNLPGYSPCERVFDPYAPGETDVKRNLTQLKYEPYRLEVPIEALPTLQDLESSILG